MKWSPEVKKKDIQGIIIIVAVVAIIVALAIVAKMLKTSNNIDKVTLCQTDTKMQYQKVILIDKSDKWNKNNIEKINNWLSDIHQGVPTQNRLTILSIAGDGRQSTEVKKLFDKCSPGTKPLWTESP